jgi:hypothetical protein
MVVRAGVGAGGVAFLPVTSGDNWLVGFSVQNELSMSPLGKVRISQSLRTTWARRTRLQHGATPVAGVEKLMVFFCDNRWR